MKDRSKYAVSAVYNYLVLQLILFYFCVKAVI